jgi:predicted aspartyl protease
MTGQVTSERRITLRLLVTGPGGVAVGTTALLDTGFSGALTLPPSLVRLLDLPLQTTMPVTLAHGLRVTLRIFEAQVLWHGQQRSVPVHECDNVPLVGVGLVYGSRLRADVLDGGELSIEPIAPGA